MPKAKRKYGYFCLPVLYGDNFVGRIDCKNNRKTKTLHINKIHYESKFKSSSIFKKEMENALELFSEFNQCDKITYAGMI